MKTPSGRLQILLSIFRSVTLMQFRANETDIPEVVSGQRPEDPEQAPVLKIPSDSPFHLPFSNLGKFCADETDIFRGRVRAAPGGVRGKAPMGFGAKPRRWQGPAASA